MNSIRKYTSILEMIGAMIILILMITLLFGMKSMLEKQIVEEQKVQLDGIYNYLDGEIEIAFQNFNGYANAPESERDLALLAAFSDVYSIDKSYNTTLVLKSTKGNKKISDYTSDEKNDLVKFIQDMKSGETRLSPMMADYGKNSVSIYAVSRVDESFLVGRICTTQLTSYLKKIAKNRGISILLVSDTGKLIISTSDDVPFASVEYLSASTSVGRDRYILVWRAIDYYQNNLVMFVPYEKVLTVTRLIMITLLLTMLSITITFLLKLFAYGHIITRPIRNLAEAVTNWGNNDPFCNLPKVLLQTKEINAITKTFIDKNNEINTYLEEITAVNEELTTANEELEIREARYRTLVENVDDWIYDFDPNGKLSSVNESFEKAVGETRDTLIGKTIFEIDAFADNLSYFRHVLQQLMTTKQKQVSRYVFKKINKQEMHLQITWVPIFQEDGSITSILATHTDISELINTQDALLKFHETERYRLEKMVHEKNESLSNALKELINREKLASLGGLVSGIAHEINTPLGVSVLATSYMHSINEKNKKKIADQTLTLSELNEYARIMAETQQILDTNLNRAVILVKSFKSIAVNQHIEEKTKFNVREYIDMILISLKHVYKGKGHEFVVTCPENLEIFTYSGAISQIFTNLIMNSITHAFQENEKGLMEIDVSMQNQMVRILYQDNGCGMSESTLEKIYEPFYTTNRGNGSSGLGMNVVYNIVTGNLDGKICCSSTLGFGTQFSIEFPI